MSFERKYVAPSSAATRLLARLRALLPPDGDFPVDVVHSVYFDTPSLRSVAEVTNGDRQKAKMRVRWYESSGPGLAFAECKRKSGAQRAKLRVPLAGVDVTRPLHDPAWRDALPALRRAGVELPFGNLQPTVHVVYRRHRFLERSRELRIALDTEIRVAEVHPRLARRAAVGRRPLPWVVLEAKGADRFLPRSLSCVHGMGARRSAFSKYGLLVGEM